MKIFSPETIEKIAKFRKIKRAYYSLIFLVILFCVSLPAELVFNDRPLAMKVDQKWYFPVLKDYTYKDFGGDSHLPISDYHGHRFDLTLKNQARIAKVDCMFGDDDEFVSKEKLLEESKHMETLFAQKKDKRDYFTYKKLGEPHNVEYVLWPLIGHSYRSSRVQPHLKRQTYAPPFVLDKKTKKFKSVGAKFEHYLGTDKHGKDILARLVYGFRISLFFGLALAFSGAVIGTLIGAIQGYFGGVVDLLGQRATEVWGSIPQLFVLMILSSFLTKAFFNLSEGLHYLMLFFILTLTAWMAIASYMRAEFLRSRNLEYVKAAKALGLSNFKIMMRHILPNSLTPIVTFLPFNISAGLLALVSLDFLGFGVKYPAPSLGELLAQGQENLSAWWIILPSFLVVAITLVLLTFIGEGVRHAFDPRKR